MSRPKIGHILPGDGNETRDAIHFPIIPVIAACSLAPGSSICLFKQSDGTITAQIGSYGGEKAIIVDPYLSKIVEPGERFYAFMLPESTQRLWHDWTHRAIDR